MRARSGAKRQASETAPLGNSANAPHHLPREDGLGHAPAAEAGVKTRDRLGPLVLPASLQEKHEAGEGAELEPHGLPKRDALVAGNPNELLHGVEDCERNALR